MTYIKEIHAIQTNHLKAQQRHLNLVRNYHLWMMDETKEALVKDLHRTISETLTSALAGLDKLIQELEQAAPVDAETLIGKASSDQP